MRMLMLGTLAHNPQQCKDIQLGVGEYYVSRSIEFQEQMVLPFGELDIDDAIRADLLDRRDAPRPEKLPKSTDKGGR